MTTYIYALYCPIAKTVRYVGKSDDPEERLKYHVRDARTGKTKHHCARWINKLLAQGLMPELRILATVTDGVRWQDVECAFIALAASNGWKLTNVTKGGEGVVGVDAETMARRVASWKKTFQNPEVKARKSRSLNAANARPEVKAARSNAAAAAWRDKEKRERFIAGAMRQEVRESKSARLRELHQDPEYSARHAAATKAALSTPSARAAQSARSKAVHANPEIEARRIASLKAAAQRPEVKRRMSAAATAINARPEVRAAKKAATKVDWDDPLKRAHRIERLNDPEVKARHRAARRAACDDQNVIAKYSAAKKAMWSDKEKRASMLASRKAMWSDPVRRAQLIEAQKTVWKKRKQASA